MSPVRAGFGPAGAGSRRFRGVASRCACARHHPCSRRARSPARRGRGASPARRPRVLDRRTPGQGLPGSEGEGPERHHERGARVAAPAAHRQPRAGGAEEGRVGFRPSHRARGACRLAPDPRRAARSARRSRGARAGRPRSPRTRRARRRRGGAPGRSRPTHLSSRVRAGGCSRRDRADSGRAPRPGGRLSARHLRAARRRSGRNGATERGVPTSRTCGARSAHVARSSWRRRAGTTFCSRARRARGRPCLPAGSRASSRS